MTAEILPTRTRQAYDVIKRRIIELELAPGAPFTEGELAAELGLSKTPVREALARLRQENLVEAVARSGYRVTPVTVKQARDLFQLRTLLEGEAAAIAAERGVDLTALQKLEKLVTTSYDRKDRSSITTFLRANTRFHVTLASLGGNDALAATLQQVLEQLERLFHLGLAVRSRGSEMIHEHRELLAAVKSGDAETARKISIEQANTAQLMVLDALLSSDSIESASIVAEATTRTKKGKAG
jgi:DNA-binding GntR family transcriptional regulator